VPGGGGGVTFPVHILFSFRKGKGVFYFLGGGREEEHLPDCRSHLIYVPEREGKREGVVFQEKKKEMLSAVDGGGAPRLSSSFECRKKGGKGGKEVTGKKRLAHAKK